MKKFFALFLLLFVSSLSFAASLRDYVCIVRPKLSEQNEQFLKDFSSFLNTRGYKKYAEYVEDYLSGVFGSGFIYYASNGKPYILTNRHVIQSAESAIITFDNDDGSTSEFKDLKIVYIDEDVDLALIALPENFKKPGLVIKQNSINDGDSVWSAGFPALGNEPTWQLGNGIISNSRAKIKQLINPEISTLIQHTAEIDGGNSGGPLLIKSDKEPCGYVVIGINTWKALYRQNTNFSIPANLILSTIEKGISKTTSENFDSRVKAFCRAVEVEESDFSTLVKYISNDMVSNSGKQVFLNNVATAPTEPRNEIIETFAENPIEGLRLSLAYKIWKDFNSKGYKNITLGETDDTGAFTKQTLKFNDEIIGELFWCQESGIWKIKSSTMNDEKKSSKNKKNTEKKDKNVKNTNSNNSNSFKISEPYSYDLNLDLVLPFESIKPGFEISFRYLINFIGIGGFFLTEKTTADVTKEKGNFGSTYTVSEDDYLINTFGISAILQIPLNFEKIVVTPFLEGKVGYGNFSEFVNNNGGICSGFSLGTDVIYKTSDNFGIGVGSKYQFMNYVNAKSNMLNTFLVIRIGESDY